MTYQSKDRDEDALRHDIIRLAKMYGRYGYRKIAQLLRISGWKVNHKKVERIWREEGLQLPERHKRKRRLYNKDSSIIRMRPNGPNHVWAVDFVHDKLSNNRPYKMLTVVDEYTRQALAVHVAHKMSAADVQLGASPFGPAAAKAKAAGVPGPIPFVFGTGAAPPTAAPAAEPAPAPAAGPAPPGHIPEPSPR